MNDFPVPRHQPLLHVPPNTLTPAAHPAPIYPTVENLIDRLALPTPNEHTDRYQKKARDLGVYIQTGSFLEIDPKWPKHVFNPPCLIGPAGILYKYRKTHPWLPWE